MVKTLSMRMVSVGWRRRARTAKRMLAPSTQATEAVERRREPSLIDDAEKLLSYNMGLLFRMVD